MRVSGFSSDQIVAYAQAGNAVAWLQNVNVSSEATSYTAHFRGHRGRRVDFSVSAVDAIPSPAIRPARPYTDITSGPADYLIITHADFENDLGALVSAREGQGLTVETVVADDIYAQFSGGNYDAEAIRTYLGTIADAWGLQDVLFVGGDTTDYLGQVSSSISFIPTLYVPTHVVVQYTPSDPAMTDWDGNGVPNLAHGRLPVRTSQELQTVGVFVSRIRIGKQEPDIAQGCGAQKRVGNRVGQHIAIGVGHKSFIGRIWTHSLCWRRLN